MKPHIERLNGMWVCSTKDTPHHFTFPGFAFTPLHAYRNWRALNWKTVTASSLTYPPGVRGTTATVLVTG